MENTYLPTTVEKALDPFIDLGNLLIVDNDPLDVKEEKTILGRTRDNVQCLFNSIWQLERETVEDAVVVKLPPVAFRLPREKVIPKERPMTKWEQYAQAKGIKKRKRSSKVYDPVSNEWKARYGYHRANDDTKDWLIEIPDNKDPMVDYFAEREKAKKERVQKNELQRLRNLKRQSAVSDISKPLGISQDLENRNRLTNQIRRARASTASLGKFQPALKNEKIPKEKGITHKFEPNEVSAASEKKRYMEVFDRICAKKPQVVKSKLLPGNRQADVSLEYVYCFYFIKVNQKI
uniref:Ribosome biogenesis regulatory protein n=1 Tax=Syphacia muris TaxID=451379 RepID=A0A0N5AMH1_9BILA